MAKYRHITKRTDSKGHDTYLVRVNLGRDANGKRIVKCCTCHTLKVAQQKVNEILRDKDLGRVGDASRKTLADFIDEWLTYKEERVRHSTMWQYRKRAELYLKPFLGDMRLDKVTPTVVKDYLVDLRAKTGIHVNTAREALGLLTRILEEAVRWQVLLYNPAKSIDPPKRSKREDPPVDVAAALKFLDAALWDPDGLIFIFAMLTGLRSQEYFASGWSDLDDATGELQITRTVYRPTDKAQGEWRFEECKTTSSRRVIVIPEDLLPLLRQHRARQAEQRLKAGPAWQDHGLIFSDPVGAPMKRQSVAKRFKTLLKRAGLPLTVRLHDLRHSTSTVLMELGEHPKIMAQQLGHSTPAVTLSTYSHVTTPMLRAAAAKLNGLLNHAIRASRDHQGNMAAERLTESQS